MQLSVRQAALQAGISRQTLFRYIKEGKISATLSHTGEKQIEVTELMRVFGPLQPTTVTSATVSDQPRLSQRNTETPATVTYQIELERLKAQLEIKNAELALAKERIAELKTRESSSVEEKNRLLTLVEQQSRLLSAPPPTPQKTVTRTITKKPATAKKLTATATRKTVAAKTAKAPIKMKISSKAPVKQASQKSTVATTKKPSSAKKPSR